jgi:hypothetical protein
MLAALAAMVVVMALTTFTLHKNSPLVAARPQINTSEPSTTGQEDIETVGGRERSIERYPEQRARERSFVPLGPAGPRSSTPTP